jgi:branched-chain amino acid transport system substrate-binding protein
MSKNFGRDTLSIIFFTLLAVILLFLARWLIFFVLRPFALWLEELYSYLTSGNLLELQITGIGWLDIILRIIIAISLIIVVGLWKLLENADEPEINKIKGIPGQLVWNIIWSSFISIGYGLQPFLDRFGSGFAIIITVPLALFLCFFNTILDYHNFVSLVISGVSDSPYMDIFTDRKIIKYINNTTYIAEFVKWATQDAVVIHNFFDYWFYTLRASILGFRFEGIWQWLVAFPINVVASIWYFYLGCIHILNGMNTEKIDLDEEALRLRISLRNQKIPNSNLGIVMLSIVLSLILFFHQFGWITTGSKVNLAVLLPFLSFGEKYLIAEQNNFYKESGIKAFAQGDFATASAHLQISLKQKPNEPEPRIYLNNAKIGERKSYAIAVADPIGKKADTAKEILRGVAQAQEEINQAGGIKGIPVKLMIANDEDNKDIALKIADALVKNPSVLGVVGHFSSDVSLEAGRMYQEGKLAMISPTSTSVQISGLGNYIFRTVPSDRFAGQALANYLTNQLGLSKTAIFFNSSSNYSKSIKNEFIKTLTQNNGKVVAEFDLGNPSFSPKANVDVAISQGAEAIALLPNEKTRDRALQVAQINQGRLPVLGGDSAYHIDTLKVGKENVMGMVLAIPWHRKANLQEKFTKDADRLWGADVNWRTAMAYDATKALIAALEQNPTRSGVQKALSAPNFSAKGASGVVKFLPTGDRNAPIQLVKVIRDANSRSGTGYDFVPLSPATY